MMPVAIVPLFWDRRRPN